MVKVRSVLSICCYLLSSPLLMRPCSSNVNTKEPEHQKHDSQPHASGTSDTNNRQAFSHGAQGCACSSRYSGVVLQERVQQREKPHRTERTKPNQNESPKRPRLRRGHRRKSCCHQRFTRRWLVRVAVSGCCSHRMAFFLRWR